MVRETLAVRSKGGLFVAEIISEILALSGVSEAAPSTLPELIQWLVQITVGVSAISGVFCVLGKLTEVFSYRRW